MNAKPVWIALASCLLTLGGVLVANSECTAVRRPQALPWPGALI